VSNSEDNRTGRGFATIRDSFFAISPGFAQDRIFRSVLWSIGLGLDAMRRHVERGIKSRMPGVGDPVTQPLIGADRLIDRGPREPETGYARRLTAAFDTWANAGGPYALLENLDAYFRPGRQQIMLVSDRSRWHYSFPDPSDSESPIQIQRQHGDAGGVANWLWDPAATGAPPYKYWRGWVIINAAGLWTQWHVGTDGVIVGDGHTVGSTATYEEVSSVRRIVKRFKGAHAWAVNIIVAFSTGTFTPDSSTGTGDMPNGHWDQLDQRSLNAIYWQGVATP
jgi:hypothetical protein